MTQTETAADFQRYLQAAREALLWKLDGLSEYDIRRPMTATGTNLLGLVKHVANMEAGYLGSVFNRPFPEPMADMADLNSDMWATADESREQVVGQYKRIWAHCDETIATLSLDAIGHVPWWPAERAQTTLHRILIHHLAEINRHAGHADIVRELIDGAAGLRQSNDNLASHDSDWWKGYREKLEDVALEVAKKPSSN